MSANVHRLLVQPHRAFLSTAAGIIMLSSLAATVFRGTPNTRPLAFTWWGLIFPLAIGLTLAATIHEPMHRPFGVLLPGVRQRFLRSHAWAVGSFALVLGGAACLADRALPFLPLVGVAAAGLSFALPFEPGWRWAGSRTAGILVSLGGAALIWFAVPARAGVIAQPTLCGAAAFAFTALNFAVAFSASRRRERAAVAFTSYLSAFFSPEMAALRAREDLGRSKGSRVRWLGRKVDGTIWSWLRVVQHEQRIRWRGSLLACGLVLGLSLVLQLKAGVTVDEAVLRDFFGWAAKGGRAANSYPFYLALLVLSQGFGSLRTACVYPISRTRRARVNFAVSAWQIAMNYGLLAGAALGLAGIACWRLSLPFPVRGAAEFLLSLGLVVPLLPLMQWCLLHVEVRRDRTLLMLGGLLSIVPLTFAQPIFGIRWGSVLLSPSGFAAWALAVGATQWAYYAALRRFYRDGDLLQHGTTRRNFGLV